MKRDDTLHTMCNLIKRLKAHWTMRGKIAQRNNFFVLSLTQQQRGQKSSKQENDAKLNDAIVIVVVIIVIMPSTPHVFRYFGFFLLLHLLLFRLIIWELRLERIWYAMTNKCTVKVTEMKTLVSLVILRRRKRRKKKHLIHRKGTASHLILWKISNFS